METLEEPLVLARSLAGELIRTCPEEYWRLPIRVSRVARYLGYSVEARADLPVRARLDPGTHILVRRDIAPEIGRFALAHEIAHAYLHETHPHLTTAWSVTKHERFANFFASELLFPATHRASARESLSIARSIRDVLGIARHFGVTTTCLLNFAARQEQWFYGSDLIVLRIKYAENRRTRREPRLRVIAAFYDNEHFYVPSNQSVFSLTGDDEWLMKMRTGETRSSQRPITLSVRTQNATRRWKRFTAPAYFDAMRLKEAAHDEARNYLALARVLAYDRVS